MSQETGLTALEHSFDSENTGSVLFAGAICCSIFLASRYSYLLFHTMAELFSVTIAACVFVIAWNSRQKINNNYLLLLGISYLFVAGLDVLHTIAYKGMGIIKGYDDDNLPPQIWLVSRYLEAGSLIVAPLLINRRLRIGPTIATYTGITGLALLSIFYWETFPLCFVKGVGLTPFKKVSEYLICLLLVTAMALLYRNRENFDAKVQRYLILSMLATIATELSFTFYVHLYGISNLIGHYFKITAYYFIYKAIIQTGFLNPYDLLFRELQQANKQLALLANTDPLTGIFNRLGFNELLGQESARAYRYGTSFSLVLLDIDYFKQINDRYGHNIGDDALKQLVRLCEANIRRTDVFARWGGEEFILMLPGTTLKEAGEFAEKLRSVIARNSFVPIGELTCSFGITTFIPEDTLESLVSRADTALYSAKKEGRNRVCIIDPLITQMDQSVTAISSLTAPAG